MLISWILFLEIQCKSRPIQKKMHALLKQHNKKNCPYYKCALSNFQIKGIKFDNQDDLTPALTYISKI